MKKKTKKIDVFKEMLFGWESEATKEKRRQEKKIRRAKEEVKRAKKGRRKTFKEIWREWKEDLSDFIHGRV